MARSLNTPITDEGLTSVRFFNGRVLSAADLEAEQQAQRRRRAQLGRAQGTGIADGLHVQVTPGDAPTALRVTKGLAINRAGHPVELFANVEVSVVDAAIDIEPSTSGDFMACEALPSVTATGTGVYLLVACPATERREQAPRVAMGDGDRAGSCGPKFQVEGVRFRLVHLDPGDDRLVPEVLREPLRDLMEQSTLSPAARSRRRNLLAHWCLGTVEARRAPADLYGRLHPRGAPGAEPLHYGPLDALRTPEQEGGHPLLTPHDVPLAIFVWEDDRVTTVDTWAVRRRMHRLYGAPEPGTDRRRAEGEAAFRQFQAHLASLIGPADVPSAIERVEALSLFSFLPAAGVVPIRNTPSDAERPPFLRGLTYRPPVLIEGDRVASLLQASWLYSDITISEQEMLWVYRVRENDQAPDGTPVRYVLFTSAHLPYQGDPLFDAARWNYSHYGPGIRRRSPIAVSQ